MLTEPFSVILNLLGFVGALAYVALQLDAPERSPVETRLVALVALLCALVGVRAAHWGLALPRLAHVEEVLAAFVPLLSLFVAEGLLRRHAPGWMKRLYVIGAVVVALAALFRPASFAMGFLIMLGSFVGLSLAALGVLLALRRVETISAVENGAIGALRVGIALALPLIATDFLAAAGHAPVRAGALALLVFVFVLVRLRAGGGGRAAATDLLWTGLGALGGLGALTLGLGPLSWADAVRWLAAIWGFILVAQIIQRLRQDHREMRENSLWRRLAHAPDGELGDFLQVVLDAPELDGARLLEPRDLADYDLAALREAFAYDRVVSRSEAGRAHGAGFEQLSVLFDAHDATHAVLLTDEPVRLLLASLPKLASPLEAELQLAMIGKLARQIDEASRGGGHVRAA